MVCNKITPFFFQNSKTYTLNSKWDLINHFNIIWKFDAILMTPKNNEKGKVPHVHIFWIWDENFHKNWNLGYTIVTNGIILWKIWVISSYKSLYFWLLKITLWKILKWIPLWTQKCSTLACKCPSTKSTLAWFFLQTFL